MNTVQPPTLLLMAGLPGSGKTTLAFDLGLALGWPVLDKDQIKSPLLVGGVPGRIASTVSYEILFGIAADLLLRLRQCVILDTGTRYPFVVSRARDLVRSGNATLRVILCAADPAVRRQRLKGRVSRLSQACAAVVDEVEQMKPFAHLPANALRISTERPLAELRSDVLHFLRTPSPCEHNPNEGG